MKERIAKLIKSEKLSSSKFAEKIGVQRSSISHILSGRNKPSLDFIQKVLHAFEDLNPEWLLIGKGKMYKEKPSLFEAEEKNRQKKQPTSRPIPEREKEKDEKKTATESVETEKKEMKTTTEKKPPPVFGSGLKPIKRVVVFYSDNTFEDYTPSLKE